MPRKRYTDAQIAMVVRELDNGSKAGEMARKLGVSEQTIYTWKKRFAGMGTTEIRRLRQLEEENSRLKKLVADLSLDKVMLTDFIDKKAPITGNCYFHCNPRKCAGLVLHIWPISS